MCVVAHRLETILNSSRVMVLSGGQLVEFDSPAVLLSRPDSAFSAIVNASKLAKEQSAAQAEAKAHAASDAKVTVTAGVVGPASLSASKS